MAGNIYSYLKQRPCEGNSKTHTSLGGRKGSWHIPTDDNATFYEAYIASVKNRESLHITEAHCDVGPVLMDFDFRFKVDETPPVRSYTQQHVVQLLELYFTKLSDFVDCRDARAFVMEKPAPRIEKNRVKDGFHVVVPDIVTRPALQYMLRDRCLPLMRPIFEDVGISNSAEDCFDEAVIHTNNWLMVFSSKEGQCPYAVTSVLRWDGASLQKEDIPEDPSILVPLLSIRNKPTETAVVDDRVSEVDAYAKAREISLASRKQKRGVVGTFVLNESTDYAFVCKLVKLLSPKRADSYESWMRVGWCLRNIDHRLLTEWVSFSSRSPKFQPGECELRWQEMKVGTGLGVGSLRLWAKEDDAEQYIQLVSTDLGELIVKAASMTHYDIALVIHRMYCTDYVCTSIRNRDFYEFRGHRWHPCEQGSSLSKKLSVDVFQAFHGKASELLAENAKSGNADSTESQGRAKISQALIKVALNLKNTAFKGLIMGEVASLFHDTSFLERLDTKCHLIGFENGVYDLEAFEFRDGVPEDSISFSTGIKYEKLQECSTEYESIMRFFEQVLPIQPVREYVLLHLASCLNGSIREERFHIWTGGGSNGKSVLIALFEKSFGDYCCKFPVSLLTNKRAASNAATSEVARSKGRRFACLQEPSENERFNVGLMKELTGGDKIIARGLYREPIEFKPQFKMVLTANHLPEVTACDNGTWRRIRVIEFKSRFTHTPDPTNSEYEHMIDTDLGTKMETWREQFMALLISYYKKYKELGALKEPEEVMRCTNEYQASNDTVKEFLDEYIERVPTSSIPVTELYSVYKDFITSQGNERKPPSRKEFLQMLRPHGLIHNTKATIQGIKFKERTCQDDDL